MNVFSSAMTLITCLMVVKMQMCLSNLSHNHTHVQEKTSKLPAAIQNKAEYQHDEDDRGY
jgi:hypothetical protein